VEAFVDVSRQHGRRQVRIVHGKGIGQRRQEVRRVLERHPGVASFGDDMGGGGWGATVVRLLSPAADVADDAPSD
jgi:dsDNA-specific endonuclease/ATPase MutS2